MEYGEGLEETLRSKKYVTLKAEDLTSSPEKKENNKLPMVQPIPEKQPGLPYFFFPNQIKDINTAIESGSSEISIYISKSRSTCSVSSFSALTLGALANLKTLTFYHFIPKHLCFDKDSVKALSPLLKAPNLQKVTFTHFLAEPLLPLIPSNVEIVFDFQSRHITDPIMPIYIVKGYRETAQDWLAKYPNLKINIPEIVEFGAISKDIKS